MGTITIIGHGWQVGDLTLNAIDAFRQADTVLLHTERCACAQWLTQNGIAYRALDALYDSADDFDVHAQSAAQEVLRCAENSDVAYGVFDLRDRSVERLLSSDAAITCVAGPSLESALAARVSGTVRVIEASDWEHCHISSSDATLVREIDTRELAAEVKLRLMETYPDEWTIYVSTGERGVARTKLYQLDRLSAYDHRTCALLPPVEALTELSEFDFDQLCGVIDVLLGPNGCPWDRAQTHESLRSYMLEEAYEAVGAIHDGDLWHLADELGDVLLQVVLHAGIAQRHGEFSIRDVTTAIAQKMIHRHSHIFGHDSADTADSVGALWSRNKMLERGQTTQSEVLKDMPTGFPALLRAAKVLKRVDAAFGREDLDVSEAARQAEEALRASADATDMECALGQALFAMIALCRARGVDAELALTRAVDQCIARFEQCEAKVRRSGRQWSALTKEELGELYRDFSTEHER